jgi:hypothetical protein
MNADPRSAMVTRMHASRTAALFLALVTGLGLASCKGDPVAIIEPSNSPSLYLQPDTLHYYAVDLENIHQTLKWYWVNNGTGAQIVHNSLVPHGSTILKLTDPNGLVVYDLNIQLIYGETQETSPAGVPGTWTVELAMSGTTGKLDFSIASTP